MVTIRASPRTDPTDIPAMAPVERPGLGDEEVNSEDVESGFAAVGETAEVLEEVVVEVGGDMVNAGERLALLELASSTVLN